MPFNASGFFQRLFNWKDDRDDGIRILAERMDQEMDGMVDGINAVVSGDVDWKGPLTGVFGTAATPAYSFQGDPNTGVYRVAADTLGLSAGGAKQLEVTTTGLNATNLKVTGKTTLNWSKVNDGTGSGLDADLLDGQHGAYYRNASSLNTGKISKARLSGTYNISVSGDAQTLDGFDSSAFAKLTGGTFTGNTTHQGRLTVHTVTGIDIDNAPVGHINMLEVLQETSGADALMRFHVVGDYAIFFGLDGGLNDLVIGGWSLGASNKYRLWHERNNELVGQIAFFARTTAPRGWLKANGATVSRTSYAPLFAAIGTTYGPGNGSTTFQVPDLRGEFVRALDDGRGVDRGRRLGTHQGQDIQAHQHRVTGPAGHKHTTQFGSGSINATFAYAPTTVNGNRGYGSLWYADTTGGSETRPRNQALLACIKY